MKNKIEKKQKFLTENSFTIEHMPLSDVVDVSKFIKGSEMNLVNFNKNIVITGDKQEKHVFNKQVVVDNKILNEILNKPYDFDSIMSNVKNPNPIVLVKKEYWNFFSDEGLYARIGMSVGKEEKRNFNDFSNKQCFDDAQNSNYMFIQFLENKNHLKVIKDSKGNLACEPMVFDYIAARLDNEMYELDNLVEHLMKRDDIAFIAYAESSYKNKILKCPLTDNEPDLKGIITDIPSYNAEEGRDESITVIYYPKAEAIPKIRDWEMSEKDKQNKVYNIESFIVQEILECKKFRKQPVIVEEPQVPKRKFKR